MSARFEVLTGHVGDISQQGTRYTRVSGEKSRPWRDTGSHKQTGRMTI